MRDSIEALDGIDCRRDEIAVVRRSGGEFALLVPRLSEPQAPFPLVLEEFSPPVEPPAHRHVGGSHDLSRRGVDGNVMHRHRGQVCIQASPGLSSIDRHPRTARNSSTYRVAFQLQRMCFLSI